MIDRAQWQSVCAVGLLLVSCVVAPVAATTAGETTATATNTSNETVPPHVNPDTVQADGKPAVVADRLSSQLGARLTQSAVSLSDREYELARTALAEGYVTNLSRYAVVADEVDEEAVVEQLNLTREQQLSLIESVRDAEQLAETYQRATANGSDAEARRAARELLTTANEVNQSVTSLSDQYDVIANETDLSFDQAQLALQQLQVTTQQASGTLREREFTEAALTAELNRTQLTTRTPATISGRLMTPNGTPITNATIQVQAGGEQRTTRTAADGTFELVYRPVLAPPDTTQLDVSYVPAADAPYLPTTVTRAIEIPVQTPVEVQLLSVTAQTQFDKPVAATGQVTTDGVPAAALARIPLTLRVGGQRLATTTTNSTGTATAEGSLPASVPAGAQNLTVAVARQNLAITPANTTRMIDVATTQTTLTLNTTTNETGAELTTAGRLTTESGTALGGRPLTVTVAGDPVGTVETSDNGSYSARFLLPPELREAEREVTVEFRGDGNLAPSTATAVIFESSGLPIPLIAAAIGVISVVAIAGRVGIRGRTIGSVWTQVRGRSRTTNSSTSRATATGDPGNEDDAQTADHSIHRRVWDALRAGVLDEAVQLAYATVRHRLVGDASETRAQTHREFLQQVAGNANRDEGVLQSVTETYERVMFTKESVSKATARHIVEKVTGATPDSEPDEE